MTSPRHEVAAARERDVALIEECVALAKEVFGGPRQHVDAIYLATSIIQRTRAAGDAEQPRGGGQEQQLAGERRGRVNAAGECSCGRPISPHPCVDERSGGDRRSGVERRTWEAVHGPVAYPPSPKERRTNQRREGEARAAHEQPAVPAPSAPSDLSVETEPDGPPYDPAKPTSFGTLPVRVDPAADDGKIVKMAVLDAHGGFLFAIDPYFGKAVAEAINALYTRPVPPAAREPDAFPTEKP